MMIVDRIDNEYALVEIIKESGEISQREIPLVWLPEEIMEGDVIRKVAGIYEIDQAETEKRRKMVSELLRPMDE